MKDIKMPYEIFVELCRLIALLDIHEEYIDGEIRKTYKILLGFMNDKLEAMEKRSEYMSRKIKKDAVAINKNG